MTLLIAQLSDVHFGYSAARPEPNEERLAAALAEVAAHRPDAIFVTGDLTDDGAADDYRRLRAALARVACPVHLLVGNHDRRDTFAAAFPETPLADGFVQYVVDFAGLRCIALDTLVDGRQGGGFCAARAAWLGDRLSEAPDRPTLILAHHPPVATGIAWMDPDPGAAWVRRLEGVVAGQRHVVALAAGHVHVPSVTGWNGIPVTVAPTVAPALALSLTPIDPERPDGRPMIVDSAPGFALHRWDGRRLTTHFTGAPPPVASRYDARWQPLLRQMDAERRDDG